MRLIDASKFFERMVDRFQCCPVIGATSVYGYHDVEDLRDMILNQPPIDPETLPIVKELRGKLARYEQAEKEGRLVIAPDKLYDLMFDECSSEKSYITEYPTEGVYIGFAGDYLSPEEIGKTVFLSREDAEAALKERKSNGI